METMKLHMVKNAYTIPQEQLDYYKNEIMEMLPNYRFNKDYPDAYYAPTDKGVTKLLEVYNKEKGWLYPYFMSHPNYIGNGKIAFSADYHRKINTTGVYNFCSWMSEAIGKLFKEKEVTVNGMTFQDARVAWTKFRDILDHIKGIEQYNIGQANINVKINGMTTQEIIEEKQRMHHIMYTIDENSQRICVDCEYVYIPIKQYHTYTNYISFVEYISGNPRMWTTEKDANTLNSLTKDLDLRIVAGQKMSRVVGKFCRKTGISNNDKYDSMFAKFGDDINELDIKRHTVISINPIDYLTMSFGNSWKSCHTIDKFNDRNVNGDGYGGCYSGGTLSYMNDGSSIVFYTVDKRYDGTDFELEPKVNRCMFHLGEDKLIQGRVYPQSNDGDQTIYDEIRAIMQKVVSEMFNVNNLWINKKGRDECLSMSLSQGAHYRDYAHFNSCNVSWLKPDEGKSRNIKRILIGNKGVCPQCGDTHERSKSILCYPCEQMQKRCPHCGKVITSDQALVIDGQEYCTNCAHYCDYHQRWEIDTTMINIFKNPHIKRWSRRNVTISCISSTRYICTEAFNNNPDRYKRDVFIGRIFDIQETEGFKIYYSDSVRWTCCKEYAEYRGYKEAYNGILYHKDNLLYDRHTGVKAYIPYTEWNYELNCWNEIEHIVREHNEQMAQRDARRAAREARRSTQNVA